MICIFGGQDGGPDAGAIQKALATVVGSCDSTGAHSTAGRAEILRDDKGDEIGRSPVVPEPILIKNSLGFSSADLPDGFEFGNGVSTNRLVTLKDGQVRVISFCCLPLTVLSLTLQQQLEMERIFAGAP